jgi:hypothetical protein
VLLPLYYYYYYNFEDKILQTMIVTMKLDKFGLQ